MSCLQSPEHIAKGVSVVVPVYNSESTLVPLVEQLVGLFHVRDQDFEIILINDCSQDRSWDVICRLAAKHDAVKGLDLMRNAGQHNALLCGVRAARYDVTVTMDDDLQHPPSEIPTLLDKLAEGHDVVYGAPRELPHGCWRNLASKLTKIGLSTAMGAETARHVSAFRVFRTDLRQAFEVFRGSFVALDVLLTWGTNRFAHVFVRHEPRRVGKSNYTVRKLITQAVNMITGFSTLPLQFASLLGFVLTAFGFAMLVFVLTRYLLEGGAPPGFPFLASIISIFSGAQLFSLGVIGEYLARVHFRLMDRPSYVVRSETAARLPAER
jgi:glycosyltransferase involved in cell wall biosynthesis